MSHFPKVTILGEEVILINQLPNYASRLIATHAWQTEITESLTMRESRRKQRLVMRTNPSYRFNMPRPAAAAWRTILATIGNMRVAMPIWPGKFGGPAANWADDQLYDAQLHWLVGTNTIYTGGNWPVGIESDPDNWLVPLIVGRMSRPTIRALADRRAEFRLDVTERSPWSMRMSTWATASTPVTWPANILPDRVHALEDRSADNLEHTDVGLNREGITSGQEAPMKWGQGATLTLTSRGQIRELLAFTESAAGRYKSFSAPVWFRPHPSSSPETPDGIVARLASDEFSFEYISRTKARVSADMWQLPWELNIPDGEVPELPSSAHLYEIRYSPPDGPTLYERVTDWEHDLELSGQLYVARPIEHDRITWSKGLGPTQTSILSAIWEESFVLAKWRREADGPMWIRITECNPADVANTAELLIDEEIGAIEIQDREMSIEVGVDREPPTPRMIIGREDNRIPGTPGSDIDIEPLARTAEIRQVYQDGREIQIEFSSGSIPAAQYFAGGWILRGTGGDSCERSIIWHGQSSEAGEDAVIIFRDPLLGAAVGQSVKLYPGYDHSYQQALARGWANGFQGYPFMPNTDPSTSERYPFDAGTPTGKK